MRKDRYDYLKEYIHLLDVDIENGLILNRTNTRINKKGYKAIKLNSREFRIHQVIVVAAGFNPTGLTVNHIDGDKLNNRIDNLEVVSNAINMKHAFTSGLYDNRDYRGENHPSNKLRDIDIIEIKKLLKTKMHQGEIAKLFNVSQSTISRIKLGQNWSHL
jgi:predicted XRE-type DNA-binding protein